MTPALFRFDPDTHTYWWGDRRLLGVSEVLARTGFIRSSAWTSPAGVAARERGVAAHADAADRTSTNPHARAFQTWEDAVRAEWALVEQPLGDPRRGVAGTPDRVGTITPGPAWCHVHPIPTPTPRRVVVDLKTGQRAAWHVLQVACYAHLVAVAGWGEVDELVVVYTRPPRPVVVAWRAADWLPRARVVIAAAHVHARLYPEGHA
jgi:hypothetical protein